MVIPNLHSRILVLLRQHGPLSRLEISRLTEVRPNTIGRAVLEMQEKGLLRESAAHAGKRGRPKIPLEIDPAGACVAGLSLSPGKAEAVLLNLFGQIRQGSRTAEVDKPEDLVASAARLLRQILQPSVIAAGMSIPGFMDAGQKTVLLSSAFPGKEPADLSPVFNTAGNLPLFFDNDLHALALRWLHTHQSEPGEDVLLAGFGDGFIGASILIAGEPYEGPVLGGNELGHTRFPVKTEPCYCGHEGCLERIFSSGFLRLHGAGADARLEDRLERCDTSEPALSALIRHFAAGLTNAVHLAKPARLVLASELIRHEKFTHRLLDEVRRGLLAVLRDRMQISLWDHPVVNSAGTACWLALSDIYTPRE